MLYNYICENNFRSFSALENIFTTKKVNYSTYLPMSTYVYLPTHRTIHLSITVCLYVVTASRQTRIIFCYYNTVLNTRKYNIMLAYHCLIFIVP